MTNWEKYCRQRWRVNLLHKGGQCSPDEQGRRQQARALKSQLKTSHLFIIQMWPQYWSKPKSYSFPINPLNYWWRHLKQVKCGKGIHITEQLLWLDAINTCLISSTIHTDSRKKAILGGDKDRVYIQGYGLQNQMIQNDTLKVFLCFYDSVTPWSHSCLDGLIFIYGSPTVVAVVKHFFF